jgi:uncharacterized protein (DUF885 family)
MHSRKLCYLEINVRMTRTVYLILAVFLAACSAKDPEQTGESVAERVDRIANEFVAGYYEQYPEFIYEVGYLDGPLDRWGDHSEASTDAWKSKVDGWLAELDNIDPATVTDTSTARTYVFAREKLQALVDRRVCRMDLWDISSTWTGWPYMFASTLAVQPVATAEEREAALARLTDIARYLDVKTDDLQRGMDLGYTAGQNNVDAVIDKITTMIETPTPDSPFYSPAARSEDEAFVTAYTDILQTTVAEAMAAYRDFLANDYQGRAGPGVGENPDGEACYAASVRYHASISMDPEAIHRAGLSEMARIQSEMLKIAQESFGTSDVKGLLEELRTNPKYTFRDEQHMLDYLEAAVERGKAAVGGWFGFVPDAEMIIVAAPAYDKDSGGGFYSAASADGTRPGIYTAGTYEPTTISQAGQEATAFHESYPGHHMQVAVWFQRRLGALFRAAGGRDGCLLG